MKTCYAIFALLLAASCTKKSKDPPAKSCPKGEKLVAGKCTRELGGTGTAVDGGPGGLPGSGRPFGGDSTPGQSDCASGEIFDQQAKRCIDGKTFCRMKAAQYSFGTTCQCQTGYTWSRSSQTCEKTEGGNSGGGGFGGTSGGTGFGNNSGGGGFGGATANLDGGSTTSGGTGGGTTTGGSFDGGGGTGGGFGGGGQGSGSGGGGPGEPPPPNGEAPMKGVQFTLERLSPSNIPEELKTDLPAIKVSITGDQVTNIIKDSVSYQVIDKANILTTSSATMAEIKKKAGAGPLIFPDWFIPVRISYEVKQGEKTKACKLEVLTYNNESWKKGEAECEDK